MEKYIVTFPNLAKAGIKREPEKPADFYTVNKWYTDIISLYKDFCFRGSLAVWGGGNYYNQGFSYGMISSGYRDELIEERGNSPHLFGLALDIFIGNDLDRKIYLFKLAATIFYRVGIYLNKNIIHVDMVDDKWLEKYTTGKHRYWVCDETNKYHYFLTMGEAIEYVEKKKEC